MTLSQVLARIPFLEPFGLQVEASDQVAVHLPDQPFTRNHVGTQHAGALFTVAETAAGVAAWGVVPDDGAFVLLRRAEVRYTRRAEGPVTATATVADDAAEASRRLFAETWRADIDVDVTIRDEAGERVFEGSFDYALRPRKRA